MTKITLIILAAIFAVLLVAYTIACFCCLRLVVGRKKKQKPPENEWQQYKNEQKAKNNDYLMSKNPEDLTLKSCKGQTMKAWFVPGKNDKRFVICVHGYGSTGPNEFSHMFPFYNEEMGYNYLIPDLTAHGRSKGYFIGFGSFDAKNILLWIDYLIERFGEDIEIILHGISMGAATVMNVNEMNPPDQVKIVIEDCGFTSAYDQVYHTAKNMLGFECKHLLASTNALCKIFAGYRLQESDPAGNMSKAKNPILFIHGEDDDFVPFEFGKRLYEACTTVEKDFYWAPDANHADSYYKAKDPYEEKVKSFIKKHLDKKTAETK
ncbi:MAG: alpha/beta hydrolase [Clostridia bacterium]|nr:alpha/beta hydrolase [Clostridia bacterium]